MGLFSSLRRAIGRTPQSRRGDEEVDSVVTVPVGGDPFQAELAAAACRAAGLQVELLVTDMGQHPAGAGVQQQLLVRSEDLAAVMSVLAGEES
jgi:hypothetical protein